MWGKGGEQRQMGVIILLYQPMGLVFVHFD